MVRCRLGPVGSDDWAAARFVPLAEFGLWKYLMEHRHRKQVSVEAVSVWVPEDPALWNSGYTGEELEPVLRVRFEISGPLGSAQPVERFFHALTYPIAQEALFRHYPPTSGPISVRATAGYFLPLQQDSRLGRTA
jgi:hypothetical protein